MNRFSILTLLLSCLTAPAFAEEPKDYWSTEDDSTVFAIESCGDSYCVNVVGFKDTGGEASGDDIANAKAACDLSIISRLTKNSETQFTGGTLTDPESGKQYDANIEIISGDLHVRAFESVPAFGVTLIWPAYNDPVSRCSAF